MLFLGTGAAELYPNPFCNCDFCEMLRETGAAPRKRSCLLLDAHTMVDCGPEALAAAQLYNARLYDVDALFITHSHEDHFCFSNIEVLTMTPQRNEKPLHIYLSKGAYEFTCNYMAALRPVFSTGMTGLEKLIVQGKVVLHPVTPYEHFQVGENDVFANESNHVANGFGEHALNYIFTDQSGKKTLYACDTGLYSEANLQALKGMGINVVVMEGTCGDGDVDPTKSGHLNAKYFCVQLENLLKANAIAPDCAVYMTHINQVQHMTHAQYQAYLDEHAPIPVVVAHDGLKV